MSWNTKHPNSLGGGLCTACFSSSSSFLSPSGVDWRRVEKAAQQEDVQATRRRLRQKFVGDSLSSLSLQSSINDGADFKAVADAMKVIGFTGDEIQTVYKILATILHLVTLHDAPARRAVDVVQTVPCWQD